MEDEKVFEKEEYQLIYRTFLDTLESPEKQTQQEIKEIAKKLQEKLSEQEKEKLEERKSLKEKQLVRLQNENEKKIFTFVLENREDIFKNVNPEDIKLLSEENFSRFLLSVFGKIRQEKLASKENLENGKIKEEVVDKCVSNIRGTEAKDSLIKLAGWPLGIKVDPKNFLGSFKEGLLEKVPFLGKDKKEEEEPPLSDEEMVTTFLRKISLPILFSIASMLVFGPTTLAIVAATIGAIFAVKGGVEVLFSNNRKGTLYNPDTKKEKGKDWDNEIVNGINEILAPAKGAGKSEQPVVTTEDQLTQAIASSGLPEQVEANQKSFQKKEEERRQGKNAGLKIT
ncbi:MAG: hypothetical protein ACR5K9_03960 [Wolbachia sp.]